MDSITAMAQIEWGALRLSSYDARDFLLGQSPNQKAGLRKFLVLWGGGGGSGPVIMDEACHLGCVYKDLYAESNRRFVYKQVKKG